VGRRRVRPRGVRHRGGQRGTGLIGSRLEGPGDDRKGVARFHRPANDGAIPR
jgi:hypothetical protein